MTVKRSGKKQTVDHGQLLESSNSPSGVVLFDCFETGGFAPVMNTLVWNCSVNTDSDSNVRVF